MQYNYQGGGYPPQQPGMYPPQQPGMYPMEQQPMMPGYGAPIGPGGVQVQMNQGGYGMPGGLTPGVPQGMTGWDVRQFTTEQIFNIITTGISVQQKFDLLEAMTGCDQQNTYFVHELRPDGQKKKKKLFMCKEQSGWCARNCMSADCKPFKMIVKKHVTDEDWEGNDDVFRFERECQCTCMCCNRPELKIFYIENGQNKYLGKVVDACDFVNHTYKVYNDQDKIAWYIQAGCCQLGLCCKCPCESCEKVVFELWSGDKEVPREPILKRGSGSCLKNAISTVDAFTVPFPQSALWTDKALLMASALMIDFMMFEEAPQKGQLPTAGEF